jgi:uncharacterized membrane protein
MSIIESIKYALGPLPKRGKIFDLPMIDYSHHKIYCKGYFRPPTQEDIENYTGPEVIAVFVPIEAHGWKVLFQQAWQLHEMLSHSR